MVGLNSHADRQINRTLTRLLINILYGRSLYFLSQCALQYDAFKIDALVSIVLYCYPDNRIPLFSYILTYVISVIDYLFIAVIPSQFTPVGRDPQQLGMDNKLINTDWTPDQISFRNFNLTEAEASPLQHSYG